MAMIRDDRPGRRVGRWLVAVGALGVVLATLTVVLRSTADEVPLAVRQSARAAPIAKDERSSANPESGDAVAADDRADGPALATEAEIHSAERPSDEVEETRSAAEASPPADPHRDALIRVFPSFLTEEPDIAGFNELVRSLGMAARVVPETVVQEESEEFGAMRATGRIEFAGSAVRAKFEARQDSFSVELMGPPPGGWLFDSFLPIDPPFQWIHATFGFKDVGGLTGRVHFLVQYQPGPETYRSGWERGEARIGGYGVSFDSAGASATPMRMRRLPRGWEGPQPQAPTRRPVHDTSAYDLWLRLLRPYHP